MSKFTYSQNVAILAESDTRLEVLSLCWKHQISSATFYNWKKEQQEQQDIGKRRLKEIKIEKVRPQKVNPVRRFSKKA